MFKIYDKPYGGYRGCPTWTKVKTVLRMIHDNKCASCGGTHMLTVHHTNMWKNDLTLGNLVLLCTNCHLDPVRRRHHNAYTKIQVVDLSFDKGRLWHSFYWMSARDYFRMCRNWEYEGLLPPKWPLPYWKAEAQEKRRELSPTFFRYFLLHDIDFEQYEERFSYVEE